MLSQTRVMPARQVSDVSIANLQLCYFRFSFTIRKWGSCLLTLLDVVIGHY